MSWWLYARSLGLRGTSPRRAQDVAFDWTMRVCKDDEARALAVLLWRRLGLLRWKAEVAR